MTDQDTPATESVRPDLTDEDGDDRSRTDDRNETVADSPAPDPTEGERSAEDVPTAD